MEKIKSRFFIYIVIIIPLNLFGQPDEQIDILRSSKTFNVDVEQSYLGNAKYELPFKEVAESLFELAGLKKITSESEVSDLTISISAEGKNFSVETNVGKLYTGIELSGYISLYRSENEILTRTFRAVENYNKAVSGPGMVSGKLFLYKEDYMKLFNFKDEIESFRSVTIQIISEVFGYTALFEIIQGEDLINSDYAKIELADSYDFIIVTSPTTVSKDINSNDSSIVTPLKGILKDAEEEKNLLSMLGMDINGDEIQEWLSGFHHLSEISKFDDSYYYNFKSIGLSMKFDNSDKLTTIFVYSDSADGYRQFQGDLPYGLSFTNTRKEIESVLGTPDRSGGGEYFNCWSRYISKGIGFTYNSKNCNDLDAQIHHITISKIP